MSLSHKAYAFDYARFDAEFAPLLYQALADMTRPVSRSSWTRTSTR